MTAVKLFGSVSTAGVLDAIVVLWGSERENKVAKVSQSILTGYEGRGIDERSITIGWRGRGEGERREGQEEE